MGLQRVGHDWATSLSLSCIGGGNGNPLQCSCLENPRDGGAWWAAAYGVMQSRTLLKRLSSSSSSTNTPWIDQTNLFSLTDPQLQCRIWSTSFMLFFIYLFFILESIFYFHRMRWYITRSTQITTRSVAWSIIPQAQTDFFAEKEQHLEQLDLGPNISSDFHLLCVLILLSLSLTLLAGKMDSTTFQWEHSD